MTKTTKTFPLPGTGYPQLIEIIKAYFMCGEDIVSPKRLDEYSLNKIGLSAITRNSKFLVAVGVVEAKKNRQYKLTNIGTRLGSAIKDKDNTEMSKIWRELIEKHPFFEKLLNSLKLYEHIDKSDFKKYIILSSGKAVTRHRFDLDAKTTISILEQANLIETTRKTVRIKQVKMSNVFISLDIITALEGTESVFDCSRLIRYCKEINDNFERGNYSSVAFLSRAVVDHIPPIFNLDTFAKVAAQTPGKRHDSFKKSCDALDKSLKNIVDRSIHKQINSVDIPPFKEEINFSQDLNTLLARVVEELKTTWQKTTQTKTS